jgi:hypothetical protein
LDLTIPPGTSSGESSDSPAKPVLPPSFNDLPLDELLEVPVHNMTSEELAAFVQRMSVMRSSAQTRKVAMKGTGEKKTAAPKNSALSRALDLLAKL